MAHIKWRADFKVDELKDFVFHERDSFITLYPQGYHMTDKIVRPAAGAVLRIAKIAVQLAAKMPVQPTTRSLYLSACSSAHMCSPMPVFSSFKNCNSPCHAMACVRM